MKRPLITLITDFGTTDHYVGAMKGVMLGICPTALFVDISHDVAPYAIPEGAYTLGQAWKYFPKNTVHLIVVDPGVGSARRPILMEAAGHKFVAPDNGVLTMVFDSVEKYKIRQITAARYFRESVSQTFHGRDIFAPIAAHIASGLSTTRVGERIKDYVRIDFGRTLGNGRNSSTGTILKVDRFGNVITNFASEEWLKRHPLELRVGERTISRLAPNYAEMKSGELFIIPGSSGYLEISMNQGSAAATLGVRSGETIQLAAGAHRR